MGYNKTTDEDKNMTVYFTSQAYRKMKLYIKNVSNEVGGLFSVQRQGNQLWVDEVFLIEQTVTAASTVLSADGVAKFYQERMQADPNDDLSSLKGWWHSHAAMGVFWSGTDEATIKDFDQEVQENNWMLSIVGNHAGDLLCRMDIYSPFRVKIDNLPFVVMEDKDPMEDEIKVEIAEKVSTPVPPTIPALTSGNYRTPYNWEKPGQKPLYGEDYMGYDDDGYRTNTHGGGGFAGVGGRKDYSFIEKDEVDFDGFIGTLTKNQRKKLRRSVGKHLINGGLIVIDGLVYGINDKGHIAIAEDLLPKDIVVAYNFEDQPEIVIEELTKQYPSLLESATPTETPEMKKKRLSFTKKGISGGRGRGKKGKKPRAKFTAKDS